VFDVLKYFALGFFVFSIVGAASGWHDRRAITAEDAMVAMVSKHINVKYDKASNQMQMNYVCNSTPLYRYSLRDSSPLPLTADVIDIPIPSESKLEAKTVETLLTATTGLGLAEISLARLGGVSETRDKIAVLVGGISGYYFGHWLLVRSEPSCDSNAVIHALQHADFWRKVAHEFCRKESLFYFVLVDDKATPLLSHLGEIEQALPEIPDESRRAVVLDAINAFRQTYSRSQDVNQQITENDFFSLSMSQGIIMLALGNHNFRSHAFGGGRKFRIITADELQKQTGYQAALLRYARVATRPDTGFWGFLVTAVSIFATLIAGCGLVLALMELPERWRQFRMWLRLLSYR
jgi:hypothetical protein